MRHPGYAHARQHAYSPACDCDSCEDTFYGDTETSIRQTWTGPDAGFIYQTSDGEQFCNRDIAKSHEDTMQYEDLAKTDTLLGQRLRAEARNTPTEDPMTHATPDANRFFLPCTYCQTDTRYRCERCHKPMCGDCIPGLLCQECDDPTYAWCEQCGSDVHDPNDTLCAICRQNFDAVMWGWVTPRLQAICDREMHGREV